MNRLTFLILGFVLILNLVSITYQEYNPNDERFKILALKKSKALLDKSERDYKKAKKLFKKGFISEDELDEFKLQYETDRLNYQQYMLSVIFDKPHLSVIKANKFQNDKGDIIAEITIKNSSGGTYAVEEKALDGWDDTELKPTILYNLYISLKDQYGNMISQPYEYHLKKISLNEEKTIRFKLLKDMEAVTVASNYGDKYDEKKIFLKRKSSRNILSVDSDIYAQEIESGQSAEYNLTLEYFGELRKKFAFDIEKLPKIYTFEFVKRSNNATVSNIFFSQKNPIQNFILKIRVPEKIEDNLILDKQIEFDVNIVNEDGEIAGSNSLELTPTGKASLLLEMNNLYFSAERGKNIEIFPIKIKNEGMKDITDIDFDLFLPPGWEYQMKPEKLEKLTVSEEEKIELTLIPDKNTLSGIYQVKLKSSGKNVNKIVRTSDYELKIEINNKTNLLMTITLIVLALALIMGLIYILLKISKN